MKILAYDNELSTVIAKRVVNGHFNIKHGDHTKGGWAYSIGVDDKIMVGIDDKFVSLEDDGYILIPIYREGKLLRDGMTNIKYYISKTTRRDCRQDVLLLTTLPDVDDLEVNLVGDVKEIALGYHYKNDKRIKAPIYLFKGIGRVTIEYLEDDIEKKILLRTDINGNLKVFKNP